MHWFLAKQTGCFATGCKFNVESTDVFLPFWPMSENSSHPLRGQCLTPSTNSLYFKGVLKKKAWAVSVGGYVFSHKSSVYDPGKEKELAVYRVLQSLLTELKTRIKFFFMQYNFFLLNATIAGF